MRGRQNQFKKLCSSASSMGQSTLTLVSCPLCGYVDVTQSGVHSKTGSSCSPSPCSVSVGFCFRLTLLKSCEASLITKQEKKQQNNWGWRLPGNYGQTLVWVKQTAIGLLHMRRWCLYKITSPCSYYTSADAGCPLSFSDSCWKLSWDRFSQSTFRWEAWAHDVQYRLEILGCGFCHSAEGKYYMSLLFVFQNQLLTKGMVILRDKIRFYEGKYATAYLISDR